MKKEVKDIIKKLLVSVFFPLMVAFGTFFFTKAKYDTEVTSNEIKNVKNTIEIYKQMSDDLLVRIEFQKRRINELQEQINHLKKTCK